MTCAARHLPTPAEFAGLVAEGQELRRLFDLASAGMRVDLDAALRMPRGDVTHHRGRIRRVAR